MRIFVWGPTGQTDASKSLLEESAEQNVTIRCQMVIVSMIPAGLQKRGISVGITVGERRTA